MALLILKYAAAVLGAILLYELIRFTVKDKIIRRLTRQVRRYIKDNRIKLDTYKFMNKFVVKQQLMNDGDIHNAILEHAREKGMDIQDVDEIVEDYIDEIVPFFNLLSYYKIGYGIANFFLNTLYEVVIDRENAEQLQHIPRDSAVVFVMNHRSNVDYILVAYMLARDISISYAVGEWARVWPLEYIFKSFGAYFLRRRYRERLYHLVLEKYIQMISKQGVTQGVFIEGGLSRDGQFRDSKVGVLDYIMRIKEDRDFRNEIVFVPVGINYDWVLEDRVLTREWKERKEGLSIKDNITSLARVLIKTPFIMVINTVRYATGRLKNHGYASVSFGEPVPVSAFLKKHRNFFSLDRPDRLKLVKVFADELLEKIGGVVPVTPVCLTAAAILRLGKERFDRNELVNAVLEIVKDMKSDNRRIVIGKAFRSYRASMEHLQKERGSRKRELVAFEEEFLGINEARNMVKIALDILRRRRFCAVKGTAVIINKKYLGYIEYYSNLLNYRRKGR